MILFRVIATLRVERPPLLNERLLATEPRPLRETLFRPADLGLKFLRLAIGR